MKSGAEDSHEQTIARIERCCGTLGIELAALSKTRDDVPAQVKRVRKLGKALRGGLGLLGLGKSAGREIQAVGRLLGGYRDAVSRCETWELLGWEEDASTARAIRALLDQQRRTCIRKPPARALSWCRERVKATQAILAGLDRSEAEHRIPKATDRLRRRMAKRSLRMSRGRDEDFHEARKAIKAWLGAVDCLPEGAAEVPRGLKKLAGILGEENDLATLAAWLEAQGFREALVPELWQSIAARRAKLQTQAAGRAAKIFGGSS